MATTSPVAELRALSDLIKNAVDNIEALCVQRGQTYPLSNLPYTPESDAPRMLPDVIAQGTVIVSAAAQLVAVVRPPAVGMITQALSFHVSSCLRTAIRLHVPEILREAGPKGLHVSNIAAPTNTDSGKLARVLRVLATKHIFAEVAPDTFTNNCLSSVLDTGKNVSDILANPDDKHVNTVGIAAVMEHMTNGGFRCSSYLPEVFEDPEWSASGEPNQTALNKAFNTTLTAFELAGLPQFASSRKLLGICMASMQNLTSRDGILNGFDWKALPADSVVVDVGGGIGSQSMILAKTFDHLKFVVQDREEVVPDATKFWNANMPDALSSGRVTLQAHSFFTGPQPIISPAVFFLRMILHDWSDKYCIQILKHLRAAAGPHTQLVVTDNIISYASPPSSSSSPSSTDPYKSIPGATPTSTPPAPLLANNGEANLMAYLSDMQMLTLLNGCERTARDFERIFEASGWKVERVFVDEGFQAQNSKIVGVPVVYEGIAG
ncbi:O-methyltransferase [Cytidiella melzeri]|nr:O-methyltransferase [Cytidiella melzeri]